MGREDADIRRIYVLSLLESVWRDKDVDVSQVKDDKALTDFLDDTSCDMLQASLNEKRVSLSTSLQWHDKKNSTQGQENNVVLFLKIAPHPLTGDNLSTTIHVTSLTNSPVFSLFQSVHKIYAPLLLNNSTSSHQAAVLSQKLKDILLELDTGLQSAVAKSSDGSMSLFGIVTVQDEIQFWERNCSGRERERSAKFSSALDAIQSRYSNLESLSFDEMAELLDDTHNTLDDIWRADLDGPAQYPQARMVHFFSLVAQALHS
jgi:dynein heavy chain 2